MARYLLFVVAPFVCVVALVSFLVPNPAQDDTEAYAEKAFASGNYRIAQREYRRLLEDHPYNVGYHRGYVHTHHRMTRRTRSDDVRNDELHAYYRTLAASDDPNLIDIAQYGLGLANSVEGKYKTALGFFGKVQNDSMKYLHNSMGYCHLRLGDDERAEASFQREIELQGYLEGAVNNYAKLLLRQGRLAELESVVIAPKYEQVVHSSVRRDLFYAQRRFLPYFASILSSYRHSVIVEGLVSAAAIAVVWLLFVRGLDMFEPERIRFLVMTFLISCVFCELATPLLYDFFGYDLGFRLEGSFFSEMGYCIFGIGLIEEFVKLVPVLIVILATSQVNESTDLIVYASMAALGFAFQENLAYFHPYGLNRIVGRAVTSTILHMALSSIAIYGLLLSKYKKRPRYYIPLFFLVACLLHGLYDLPLLTTAGPNSLRGFVLLTFILAVAGYRIAFVTALGYSEFFRRIDFASVMRRSGRILVFGLSYVILLQYVVLALRFGPRLADHSMRPQFVFFVVIIAILYSTLGKIRPDGPTPIRLCRE